MRLLSLSRSFSTAVLYIKTDTLIYIPKSFEEWGQTFMSTYNVKDINKKPKKLRPHLNPKKKVYCKIILKISI